MSWATAPDAGRRVEQDREDGAVPQSDRIRDVDRPRSVRAWSRPISGVLPSTTEWRSARTVAAGLMTQTWRTTRRSKKRRKAARWSFFVGTARGNPWKYSPTSPGADARQLETTVGDPAEELPDRMHVVLAGVGVGDLGLEEFLPGELGRLAGGLDDRRGIAGCDRPGRICQLSARCPADQDDCVLLIRHP